VIQTSQFESVLICKCKCQFKKFSALC